MRAFIIGIDEVGRGPLAGPIVVGAVLMPARLRLAGRVASIGNGRGGLRDSKKLTAKARGEWAHYIKTHPRLAYALARVSPRMIDRVNIARAANLAALRAVRRLLRVAHKELGDCRVYLDGGLYMGNGRARLPGTTVIKGDENIPAVALASIVAKVHRDAIMTRYGKKFPGYGFEVHKGYGTAAHRAAIKRKGPTEIHRASFVH